MKIAIITFSRAKNYGGILQAYSLYKYLADIGNEVVFIDYIMERSNIYNPEVFVECATRKSRIWGKNKLLKNLWKKLYFERIKKDYLLFSHFIEQYCKFTKRYFSSEELINNPPVADIYISGSDQIWNSDYAPNKMIELPFYLNFVDGRKISYASSFGKDNIPDSHKEQVKSLLSSFSKISVREKSGKEILNDLGLASTVVLDPTLLLEEKEWINLSKKIDVKKKYILLYQVKYDKNINELADYIADKLGLKLVILTMNYSDRRKYRKDIVMTPSVEEWLTYIRNAELIFTDSFHASVFSIIYKRKFIVNSASRKGMATRIHNLLEILKLTDREMIDFNYQNLDEILKSDINWDETSKLLSENRKKSQLWLNEAIREAKGNND